MKKAKVQVCVCCSSKQEEEEEVAPQCVQGRLAGYDGNSPACHPHASRLGKLVTRAAAEEQTDRRDWFKRPL